MSTGEDALVLWFVDGFNEFMPLKWYNITEFTAIFFSGQS